MQTPLSHFLLKVGADQEAGKKWWETIGRLPENLPCLRPVQPRLWAWEQPVQHQPALAGTPCRAEQAPHGPLYMFTRRPQPLAFLLVLQRTSSPDCLLGLSNRSPPDRACGKWGRGQWKQTSSCLELPRHLGKLPGPMPLALFGKVTCQQRQEARQGRVQEWSDFPGTLSLRRDI